jgi:hypothetical protein
MRYWRFVKVIAEGATPEALAASANNRIVLLQSFG